MSCIHYKFKCDKRFDSVVFDGCSVTLDELKRLVIKKKGLENHVVKFDLIATNAQTKEVYKHPTDLIQCNSSVILARIPARDADNPMESTAVKNDKLTTVKLTEKTKSLLHLIKEPQRENTKYFWTKKEQRTPVLNNNSSNVTAKGQPHSKDHTTIDIGSRKVHIHGTVPHPSYICHRCNRSGHFKHMCPLLLDPSKANQYYQPNTIKRATGIPRSQLIPLRVPVPGAYITSDGIYVIPRIDAEAKLIASGAYQSDETGLHATVEHGIVTHDNVELSHKPYSAKLLSGITSHIPVVPRELIGPMCKTNFVNAVMTPCCNENFCDSCIGGKLFENDEIECHSCHKKNVSSDNIHANTLSRKAVASHIENHGSRFVERREHGFHRDMEKVFNGIFSCSKENTAGRRNNQSLSIDSCPSNIAEANGNKVHSEGKQKHTIAGTFHHGDNRVASIGMGNDVLFSNSGIIRVSNNSTLMVPKQYPMDVYPEANAETKEVREKKIASGTLDNPVQRSPNVSLHMDMFPIADKIKKDNDEKSLTISPSWGAVTSTNSEIKSRSTYMPLTYPVLMHDDNNNDSNNNKYDFDPTVYLSTPSRPHASPPSIVPFRYIMPSPPPMPITYPFFRHDDRKIGLSSTARRHDVDRPFYLPPPPNPFASIPSIVPLRSTTPVPPSMLLRDPVLMIDDRRTTSRSNGLSSIARRHDSGANASNFHRTSDMRRTTKSPVYRGRERNRHYPGRSRNSEKRIQREAQKHRYHPHHRHTRSIKNQYYKKRCGNSDKTNDLRTSYRKDQPSNERHRSQVRSKTNHISGPMSGKRSYHRQFRRHSRSTRHPKFLGKLEQRHHRTHDMSVSSKPLHKSNKSKRHTIVADRSRNDISDFPGVSLISPGVVTNCEKKDVSRIYLRYNQRSSRSTSRKNSMIDDNIHRSNKKHRHYKHTRKSRTCGRKLYREEEKMH